MTTTFESPASRAVEDQCLALLKREWRITRAKRLPDFAAADFGIERWNVDAGAGEQAIVEIKGRTRAYLSAFSVEIAAKKVRDLKTLAVHYGGVKAYLVFVMLLDRSVWYIDVAKIDDGAVFLGGRTPRPNSANDQEPMVYIPLGQLEKVSETIDGAAADAAIAWNREHKNG